MALAADEAASRGLKRGCVILLPLAAPRRRAAPSYDGPVPLSPGEEASYRVPAHLFIETRQWEAGAAFNISVWYGREAGQASRRQLHHHGGRDDGDDGGDDGGGRGGGGGDDDDDDEDDEDDDGGPPETTASESPEPPSPASPSYSDVTVGTETSVDYYVA